MASNQARQIAPEMEYATVARWLKREGDAVAEGEPIVEVEAEKANHELEAPATGRARVDRRRSRATRSRSDDVAILARMNA